MEVPQEESWASVAHLLELIDPSVKRRLSYRRFFLVYPQPASYQEPISRWDLKQLYQRKHSKRPYHVAIAPDKEQRCTFVVVTFEVTPNIRKFSSFDYDYDLRSQIERPTVYGLKSKWALSELWMFMAKKDSYNDDFMRGHYESLGLSDDTIDILVKLSERPAKEQEIVKRLFVKGLVQLP